LSGADSQHECQRGHNDYFFHASLLDCDFALVKVVPWGAVPISGTSGNHVRPDYHCLRRAISGDEFEKAYEVRTMKDLLNRLQKLKDDADDCLLISRLATDPHKRKAFAQLAEDY
jgi:hypothetical protein